MDSYTPVDEFKLSFRRLPQGTELDNSIDHTATQLMKHQSSQTYGYRGSYGTHWSKNEWRDVVLPAVPVSHHYTQWMSYLIRGLDPDQHYEARVEAR